MPRYVGPRAFRSPSHLHSAPTNVTDGNNPRLLNPANPAPPHHPPHALPGSTLRNANLLCAFANLVGFVFLLLAFTTSQTFAAFMGLFAVGQLIIFLLQVRR